jgi:hypothetical protein
MKRLLPCALLASLLLTTGHARLGETLEVIKARFGRPAAEPKKDVAVWNFDVQDGQVVYTVTFDAQGRSIAEGLKPLRHAVFAESIAQDFVDLQLEPFKTSKTARVVKPGEKYTFGGKSFVCGEDEFVVVDPVNAFLLVWTRRGLVSVIIVRPALV